MDAAQFGYPTWRILVVGVNEDATIQALKGPGRPRFDRDARMSLLAMLEPVTYVIAFPEPDASALFVFDRSTGALVSFDAGDS